MSANSVHVSETPVPTVASYRRDSYVQYTVPVGSNRAYMLDYLYYSDFGNPSLADLGLAPSFADRPVHLHR